TLSRPALRVLYDLSARSNHPKSVAIARALADHDAGLALRELTVHEVPGSGVETRHEGVLYRLGDPGWAARAASTGVGPVLTATGTPLAVLDSVELLRPGAAREARELAREGYQLWIASGDAEPKVRTMAARLGVPAAHAFGD